MADRRYRAKNFSTGGGVENVSFVGGRAAAVGLNRLSRSLDQLSAAAFNYATKERDQEHELNGNAIYQGVSQGTDRFVYEIIEKFNNNQYGDFEDFMVDINAIPQIDKHLTPYPAYQRRYGQKVSTIKTALVKQISKEFAKQQEKKSQSELILHLEEVVPSLIEPILGDKNYDREFTTQAWDDSLAETFERILQYGGDKTTAMFSDLAAIKKNATINGLADFFLSDAFANSAEAGLRLLNKVQRTGLQGDILKLALQNAQDDNMVRDVENALEWFQSLDNDDKNKIKGYMTNFIQERDTAAKEIEAEKTEQKNNTILPLLIASQEPNADASLLIKQLGGIEGLSPQEFNTYENAINTNVSDSKARTAAEEKIEDDQQAADQKETTALMEIQIQNDTLTIPDITNALSNKKITAVQAATLQTKLRAYEDSEYSDGREYIYNSMTNHKSRLENRKDPRSQQAGRIAGQLQLAIQKQETNILQSLVDDKFNFSDQFYNNFIKKLQSVEYSQDVEEYQIRVKDKFPKVYSELKSKDLRNFKRSITDYHALLSSQQSDVVNNQIKDIAIEKEEDE
jgi:hypothetical protein